MRITQESSIFIYLFLLLSFQLPTRKLISVVFTAINMVSLCFISLALMRLRRQPRESIEPATWHIMFGTAGFQVGLLYSSLSGMSSKTYFAFNVTCSTTSMFSACSLQGAALIYFLTLVCFAWLTYAASSSRLGNLNGLSAWVSHIPALLVAIIGLVTGSVGPNAHYPWCFAEGNLRFGLLAIVLASVACGAGFLLRMFRDESNLMDKPCHIPVAYRLLWIPVCAILACVFSLFDETDDHFADYVACAFERFVDNPVNTSLDAAALQCADRFPSAVVWVGLVAAASWGCVVSLCLGMLPADPEVVKFVGDSRATTAVVLWGNSVDPQTKTISGAPPQTFDFIVLGGGSAAYGAVKEFTTLLSARSSPQVAMISSDGYLPFSPSDMVHALATKQPVTQAQWQPVEWWNAQPVVRAILNTTITRVDVKQRLLSGFSASPNGVDVVPVSFIASKALIIATGATANLGPPITLSQAPLSSLLPRWSRRKPPHVASQPMPRFDPGAAIQRNSMGMPPAPSSPVLAPTPSRAVRASFAAGQDPVGLVRLRTLATGIELSTALNKEDKAIVVGGGLLGLDCAYICRSRGVDVTLVCPASHLLAGRFDPNLSTMYQLLFESKGVEILTGTSCETVLTQCGNVTGIKLAGGQVLHSRMVILACGIKPNIDLFKDQLQLERSTNSPGILVDQFLMTSADGVYAIGDACTLRFTQNDSAATRHLLNALNSGKSAAQNAYRQAIQPQAREVLKVRESYVPHPNFELNHFGLRCFVTGDRLGPDVLLVTDQSEKDICSGSALVHGVGVLVLWLWENRVVGGFVCGATPEEMNVLERASKDQWLIKNVAVLRQARSISEALIHLRESHF
eukprot:c10912_g1_i1.p1 GENE.c10912_g1_i1~~c10912_g1_i1.p1  ORF type:complete len:855 (+),score=130.29 c10912_g1_i1:793-3357(+)